MNTKMRRRFRRAFAWPRRLLCLAVYGCPWAVAAAVFVRGFFRSFPELTELEDLLLLLDCLIEALSAGWRPALFALLFPLPFRPLLRAMRNQVRELYTWFEPLGEQWQEQFLCEAKDLAVRGGFYCSELGVWFWEFTLGKRGFFGRMMIPYQFLDGAGLDRKRPNRLWLWDQYGAEHLYRSFFRMLPAQDCLRALEQAAPHAVVHAGDAAGD